MLDAITHCSPEKMWSIVGAMLVLLLAEHLLGKSRFGSSINLALAIASFVLYLLGLAYKNFKERKSK